MLLSPSVDSYAQVEIGHPHCQPPFNFIKGQELKFQGNFFLSPLQIPKCSFVAKSEIDFLKAEQY